MKNILISDSQAKMLRENYVRTRRFPKILSEIQDAGFECIDRELILKILSDRCDCVTDYFSDDISSVGVDEIVDKLNKLVNICIKKEEKIIPDLENLCYNTVVQLFQIPSDDVEFDIKIQNVSRNDTEFHIESNTDSEYEYEDTDEITNEKAEIDKRKLINCISTGMAMKMYSKSRKLFIDEVFELDESLPSLYSKIMKLSEYILFRVGLDINDNDHMQTGYSKIYLGNGENVNKIQCVGTIFPILLYETIKSVFELISSNGLPDSMELTKTVIDKADIIKLDPTNMRIGPYIAEKICGDDDKEIYPYILRAICDIKPTMFKKAIEEICYETKFSKQLINKIKEDALTYSEKTKFDSDMLLKQQDTYLIKDSYFSENEL